MAIQVTAPPRKPRVGGIKDITGEFVEHPRLAVAMAAGGLTWDGVSCDTKLEPTRAGCYGVILGTNAMQALVVYGDPTGGTFTLTFAGETTAPLPRDATAAAVVAALEALDAFQPGDLVGTRGPLGSDAVQIEFQGQYEETEVDLLVAADTFTGGTDPQVNVSEIGSGSAPPPKGTYGIESFEPITEPFARYVGVECFLGGDNDGETYEQQSRAQFEALEDRAVEEVLATWAVDGPQDSAQSIAAAVGRAENQADYSYQGRPVLLMSRETAEVAFAAGALVRVDGKLVTGNGSPVISTSGIGSDTVVAIGQPIVWASSYITGTAANLSLNTDMAITERVFAIGVDCNFRHAVVATAP